LPRRIIQAFTAVMAVQQKMRAWSLVPSSSSPLPPEYPQHDSLEIMEQDLKGFSALYFLHPDSSALQIILHY